MGTRPNPAAVIRQACLLSASYFLPNASQAGRRSASELLTAIHAAPADDPIPYCASVTLPFTNVTLRSLYT